MRFYAGSLFDVFADELRKKIVSEINSQDDNYILTVNIDDYTAYITQEHLLDIPEIHFDKHTVDCAEKDIPGDMFPSYDFPFVGSGKTYKKNIYIYHIPYTGNIELLQFRPSTFAMVTYNAKIDTRERCILIEIIDFYNDSSKIKSQYEDEIKYLRSNYQYIIDDFTAFNCDLESFVKLSIESRKEKILQKNTLLSSLGVPIRKKKGVPETFSIPNPKLKEKIIVKPTVLDNDFKPEPTLDNENYRKILKIINDVGKNLERLPSTYKGKSEEDIRDHILLILDPNFEMGSAGGETFNKTGKTDISLRYDSSVVFVGECKYWKGDAAFLKTIDQLLGYLTWRNSKVAVINFVQNVAFSEVLKKVKISIKSHPNYLKELEANDETWFNYKFHLNGDRNREIDLAVISFHLPK